VGDLATSVGRLVVIFDGHCGLCNRSVRWFLARDRNDRLRFAPSSSPKVAAVLARHGCNPASISAIPDSILVVRNPDTPLEQLLLRSDAVLAMLVELPRPWPSIASLLRLVPRPLRDLGYRIVARLRYHIWGKLDSCPLPTAAERERFL
jgi:predicted DCC family thiol-disulfide oxidoreductase YuxK